MPNQPERSPSTTVFFALSVPAEDFASSASGTANHLARHHGRSGEVARAAAPALASWMRTVSGANGKLRPEAQEVFPVQRDRDVEHAARVEHLPGGEAHTARGLAAANLRAEALGHESVEAL